MNGLKIMKSIDIPESLQYDMQNNRFLLIDSGYADENRFVVFSAFFKRTFIDSSSIWMVDGTFRSTPSDFYHLLTIHIYNFGK